jgi:hypothetical protein
MEELAVIIPVAVALINSFLYALERYSRHKKNMIIIESYKKYPTKDWKKITLNK